MPSDHVLVAPPAAPPVHPITPARPGRAWPWLLVLAVAVIVAAAFGWHRYHDAASADATTKPTATGGAGGPGGGGPVPVVAVAAHRGDLPVYLNALGTVTPLNVVTVRSRVDGELINVHFKEGQNVKQGDLLAQIDPRAFQAMVDQASGQVLKDEATLKNAQADLEKYKAAGPGITQQQLDTQAAVIQQNEGALKIDRGALDAAQLQLSYSTITAPFDGRIGFRRVDQGNIVHATDADGLAVITQVQPISVIFTIAQDEIPAVVRAEQKAAGGMVAEAWDRDFKVKLADGNVAAIDNQVDPTTGTVRLKATFDNSAGILFPSQFTNVRLLVDTVQNATIVPAAAVQHGPNNDYVYVVGSDQTVAVRPVKTGPSEGEQIVISDGVTPGETVVTAGTDKLRPGSKVTVSGPGGGGRAGGGATSRPGGGGRRGNATTASPAEGTR